MSNPVNNGTLLELATSSQHLQTRLELNRKLSSTDFTQWLFSRLDVHEGDDILDVGCGTGAQTIPFLRLAGAQGSVSSLDISESSVAAVREAAGNPSNLSAVVADMADLQTCIDSRFTVKKYDLAHSSYALYYSPRRQEVLRVMRDSLKPNGRLAAFTPNSPHGMVDFVRQFHAIPAEVDESLLFGPSVLEPFFRQSFWDVTVHFFHNRVRVEDVETFMKFYRATTYFVKDCEPAIAAKVQNIISSKGYFEYEKNGYLIIGGNRFAEE
jgi:SAM-dependent methyltransferase